MSEDKKRVAALLGAIVEHAEVFEAEDRFDERDRERAAGEIVEAVKRLREILRRHDLA